MPAEAPARLCSASMRTLSIALAVSLALVLAACGDGGSKPDKKAGSGPPTALTRQGYAALVAYIRLTNTDLRPSTLARRCKRLGSDAYNEEVGAIREVCVTVSDVLRAARDIEGCPKKTPSDALATRRCVADGLDRMAAYSSDAIGAVKQVPEVNAVAAGACLDYLRDRRETERFRDFARTARRTARVFRDAGASQTRLQRSATRLEIAFKRFERTTRSKAEELAEAKACRPA